MHHGKTSIYKKNITGYAQKVNIPGLTFLGVSVLKAKVKWSVFGVIGVLLLGVIVYSTGLLDKKSEPVGEKTAQESERPWKPLPPANIYLSTLEENVIITGDHPWASTREIASKLIYNLGAKRKDLGDQWRWYKETEGESEQVDTIEEIDEKNVVYSVWLTEPIEVTTDDGTKLKTDRFAIVLGGSLKRNVFIRNVETDLFSPWEAKAKYLRALVEVFREKASTK